MVNQSMKKMGEFIQNTFSVNLFVMRIFGFYPPQKYKKLYKIYAYTLYCLFTIPVPALSSIYLIIQENIDLATISENAFVVCETACFIFKLLPFIRNGDEIRKSIYMLESPIFRTLTERQKKIIEDCTRICKRNSYVFLVFCIITVITWATTPLLTGKYKLPIDVWLPYDATSDRKLFYISFFGILLGITDSALSNGMIDPLVSGLAYCATAQLKVLKDNLQHVNEYAYDQYKKKTSQENNTDVRDIRTEIKKLVFEKIKFCINHHNAILEFIELYEKTYSLSIFSQFTASVIVICICCLQLSMVEPLTYNFFAMIIFTFTLLTEIYLYCYYGTTLYEESKTLSDSVYLGPWYDYDIQCKKALLLLMERSQKPMILTVGKILDLSLSTFMMILKRSYSLLAVLKNY